MTTLELDNRTHLTTASRSFDTTAADQSPPTTRSVGPEAYSSELETLEIERNEEFHATILERLGCEPGRLVDSSEVIED